MSDLMGWAGNLGFAAGAWASVRGRWRRMGYCNLVGNVFYLVQARVDENWPLMALSAALAVAALVVVWKN